MIYGSRKTQQNSNVPPTFTGTFRSGMMGSYFSPITIYHYYVLFSLSFHLGEVIDMIRIIERDDITLLQ